MKVKKQKMKSLSYWLVIGVLGLLGIGGFVLAYSGSAQNVVETCTDCVFNTEATETVKVESVGESEMIGAGSPNRLPHGYWDTAYGYYVDGVEVIDDTARLRLKGASDSIQTDVDVQAWPTDAHYVAFQNPLSTTSSVDFVAIQTLGTVSSTFTYSCGVTSTASIVYTSTVEPDQLIDDFQIVTTTQMMDNNVTSTISNIDTTDNGTNGRPTVTVPPSWYVYCMAQAFNSAGGNSGFNETVTSTNRGWTAKVFVKWFVRESN